MDIIWDDQQSTMSFSGEDPQQGRLKADSILWDNVRDAFGAWAKWRGKPLTKEDMIGFAMGTVQMPESMASVIAKAVGKPHQIAHLQKLGIVDDASQINAVMQDVLGNEAVLMNMAKNKGKTMLYEKLRGKVTSNLDKAMSVSDDAAQRIIMDNARKYGVPID